MQITNNTNTNDFIIKSKEISPQWVYTKLSLLVRVGLTLLSIALKLICEEHGVLLKVFSMLKNTCVYQVGTKSILIAISRRDGGNSPPSRFPPLYLQDQIENLFAHIWIYYYLIFRYIRKFKSKMLESDFLRF